MKIVLYLSIVVILLWALLYLCVIFFFECLILDKTTEKVLFFIEYQVPLLVIIICNLYMIVTCLKKILQNNN